MRRNAGALRRARRARRQRQVGTDSRPRARRNRAGPVSGANRTERGRGGISRLNGRERGRPFLSTWERSESLSRDRPLPTPPVRPGIQVRFASPEPATSGVPQPPYVRMGRNHPLPPPPLQGAWRNGPPRTTLPTSTTDINRPRPTEVDRHNNPLFQPFPIGNWADLVEEERGPVSLLPPPIISNSGTEAPLDLTVNRVQLRPPRPLLPRQPSRPTMSVAEMMAELELEVEEEEEEEVEPAEDLPPPLVTFQLLMEDPSLLSVPPPAPILSREIEEHRQQHQGARPERPPAPQRAPPRPLFRPLTPPPSPPPRSPPPPYEARGDGVCRCGRRRPRLREGAGRRGRSCAGWTLALLLWSWITTHVEGSIMVGQRGNTAPREQREMTLEEAAAAAQRMGLGNHTKWSPRWWEPILREQREWKAAHLQNFDPEDFNKAKTRHSNRTIEERRKVDPTVVAGSVVWSQVWELLSLAEYAPKWKIEENKHAKIFKDI